MPHSTGGSDADRGCGWLSGRFDPETANRVFAMLGAERDRLRAADPTLSDEQAAADALANLVLERGRVKHPGRTEVVVFIDLDSLLAGARAGGASYWSAGGSVPVSTVRRL